MGEIRLQVRLHREIRLPRESGDPVSGVICITVAYKKRAHKIVSPFLICFGSRIGVQEDGIRLIKHFEHELTGEELLNEREESNLLRFKRFILSASLRLVVARHASRLA